MWDEKEGREMSSAFEIWLQFYRKFTLLRNHIVLYHAIYLIHFLVPSAILSETLSDDYRIY